LALPLLLKVDELFEVADDAVHLLIVSLETLFVSGKLSASISESELEDEVREELSDEWRAKMDDCRYSVDLCSLGAFGGLEGFRRGLDAICDV
jgi:hypothetical protein